jgi:hypothetical protein
MCARVLRKPPARTDFKPRKSAPFRFRSPRGFEAQIKAVARIERSEIRGQKSGSLAAPGFRFTQPGLRRNKKEAERRQARISKPPRLRARLALIGARSPDGVPPRHSRQRPNATAQLQHVLPGTWLKDGRYPPPPVPVQRGHPRTGRDAGRTFSPKPPGSRSDEPLPAGTALAPPTGVTGWRPVEERDMPIYCMGDKCQVLSLL